MMPGRFPLLAAAMAVALPTPGCFGDHDATATGTPGLPTVAVELRAGSVEALLAPTAADAEKVWLPARFSDRGTDARLGVDVSRRGFSAWHHGRIKPSLRIRQQERHGSPAPAYVELSRPEDPLALCNWLPDRLAAGLGLLHEHIEPVRLVLDGRPRGVYLRSLRPGDDLAAAAGRPRGTFFKGDSLGARGHLKLWDDAAAWRGTGSVDARARTALDELLAALREPATPATLARLAAVLDLEQAARAQAVAVLTASIHADAVHNHVLFYDPAQGRLEPLLWDANGFGVHAEPSLAVEVMRHPIAARLGCDPRFVHRRNELLWQLLHGAGSAGALIRTADEHFARLCSTLRNDPEIARLVLRRGVFEVEPVAFAAIDAIRDEFAAFVRARERHLLAHFAGAAARIDAVAGRPDQARITVFGAVAVRVARADDGLVLSPDGRDAALLLPGLTTWLQDRRQHRSSDGRGVSAPFAAAARLSYLVACPPDRLVVENAFTGARVDTSTPICSSAAHATRSIHPWSWPQRDSPVRLGPGTVRLDAPLEIGAGATLEIAAGTRIELDRGAGIRCFGALSALGTRHEPIEFVAAAGAQGVFCSGGVVRFATTTFADATPWRDLEVAAAPLLALGDCRAELVDCRFLRAAGNAIEVTAGEVTLRDCAVHRCHHTALLASGNARVALADCELAYARRAMLARDGAEVSWHGGRMRGNLAGVRAERSARPFGGGVIRVRQVAFTGTGQFDVDADVFSRLDLEQSPASVHPLAAPWK